MNINSREKLLFDAWSKDRAEFVMDGVVDEQSYLDSEPKLLFVLKEVNDLGGGGWDLRRFMRDGGRPQTWDNITRWVEGIRNLPSDFNWASLKDIDKARRIAALQTIAAINLSKSPGGHTTDTKLHAISAARDKEFTKEQITFYNADYVICCGTSELFHLLVNPLRKPEWRCTSRGVRYHEPEPGKYLVEYSHPQARCAHYLLHYGLVDAIREISDHKPRQQH